MNSGSIPPVDQVKNSNSQLNTDFASIATEQWIECLHSVANSFSLAPSREGARLAAKADMTADERGKISNIARNMGLRVKFQPLDGFKPSSWQLPFILKAHDGQVFLVRKIAQDGQASVVCAGEAGLERPYLLQDLLNVAAFVAIARPARTVADARVDAYIKPYEENWLRRIIFRDVGSYGHVLIASLIANILGLTGILFSMQVYDRVVPAESFSTLYVLFSGVVLAIFFDFMMRRTRMGIIDILGKRTDLAMSDVVFGHALRVRNRARPTSTGSFIAQLRDLEQVRDLLTSTTVAAIADLPFFLIFLVIFWMIGGSLVLIPIGALVMLILPGIFLQRRLKIYANEAMREASLRNAMLVEAVQGIEDIKLLQAEERFQQHWNQFNTVTGEAQLKLRGLTNSLSVWTQNVQTGVYALTVFVGAPMVIAGDITTGALVGASILGSRMLAPMGQLSQIAGRFQHARIAKKGLDRLMQMPVDHPVGENRIHCARIDGAYTLKNALFRYGNENSPPALLVRDMQIKPGERIALLGKNGAGKSTLLLALAGLLDASDGEVLVDNLALQHIDPADLRRDVGLMTQNSRLFYGTLRDNITMGATNASDAEIQRVLTMVGVDHFIRKLSLGLEHSIQEGGHGLSGGQRQAILLARLLIREPSVVLLDEPTAMMDEATERHFITQFAEWSIGRTVIIATHRMRVLELVNRLIVVENSVIALDDTKEQGLQKLVGVRKVSSQKAQS